MMQLLCDGQHVDLKENTTLTYTKSNPLFAFDDLKCERTAEFAIPATPNNNRIFKMACDVANAGAEMRRCITATVIDGVVAKDGQLHVVSYANGEYKAIFVTGDLMGLKGISNIGKVSDVWQPADKVVWSTEAYDKAANANSISNFDLVSYRDQVMSGWHRSEQVHPSYSLPYVLSSILGARNIPYTLPSGMQSIRVILGELKGAEYSPIAARFAVSDSSQPSTTQPTRAYNTATVDNLGDFFGYDDNNFATYRVVSGDYVVYYYRVRQMKALSDMQLTFDANTSDNLFLVKFDSSQATTYQFVGDYSFVKSGNTVTKTGEPLAGRSIDLPVGSLFMFVTPDDYVATDDGGTVTEGWRFTSLPHTATFSCVTTPTNGSVVRLRDNLPSITITDILKTFAALAHKVLNYDNENGITFDDANYATWPIISLEGKVTGISTMERKFANYAQKNYIEFDTDESVLAFEKLAFGYSVNNANLEEENTLQTIPFSEGGAIAYSNTRDKVYIRKANSKDTIVEAGLASDLMRVQLEANSNVTALCQVSTTIQAKAKLSLYDYNRIGAKNIIQFMGQRYVWTESRWQNGTAEFTLSKV